jgi:AraC-like DNA-binding protein
MDWKNAMSPVTDSVRGVLRPAAESGRFHHGRVAPSAGLRDIVQHFWSVHWDRCGGEPFVPETLPHPNVHLVFEARGAKIFGVHTGRFTTRLEGEGWVFGVKFRPGAFRPFLGRSVTSLRDRTVPIDEVFGARGAALARKIVDLDSDAEKAAVVERFLTDQLPPIDPNVERACSIVAEIAEDRAIVSVEQIVEQWGVRKRALQQLFNEYVGVGPKWVINRYRLHEALERLHTGTRINFTELAMELGYFDQAHFIRDFRKLVGCSPAAYARRGRNPAANSNRRAGSKDIGAEARAVESGRG